MIKISKRTHQVPRVEHEPLYVYGKCFVMINYLYSVNYVNEVMFVPNILFLFFKTVLGLPIFVAFGHCTTQVFLLLLHIIRII